MAETQEDTLKPPKCPKCGSMKLELVDVGWAQITFYQEEDGTLESGGEGTMDFGSTGKWLGSCFACEHNWTFRKSGDVWNWVHQARWREKYKPKSMGELMEELAKPSV